MKFYYIAILLIIGAYSCSTNKPINQKMSYDYTILIIDKKTKKPINEVSLIVRNKLFKTNSTGLVLLKLSCLDTVSIKANKYHYERYSKENIINSECQNIYDTIYLKEFDFPIEIHDVFPDSLNPNKK